MSESATAQKNLHAFDEVNIFVSSSPIPRLLTLNKFKAVSLLIGRAIQQIIENSKTELLRLKFTHRRFAEGANYPFAEDDLFSPFIAVNMTNRFVAKQKAQECFEWHFGSFAHS